MNAGDSGCTTGLSSRLYSLWTGDYPANGFGSNEAGLSAAIKSLLKSQMFQFATAIVASLANDQDAWSLVSSGVGFTNSWVDYGGSEQTAAYMKDAMGFVHLRGLIKSGTVTQSCFTLPSGYRPSANENFAVNSNGAFGFIAVNAAGNVTPVSGSNVWFSLAGITFKAA